MKSIYICQGLGVRGRGGALYWWRYPLLATFILLFGLSAHLSIEIFKNVGNHWQGAGGSLDGVAPLAAASASPKRNHWKMMELRRPKNNMSYVVYNTIIEQQQQQQQQQRAAAATTTDEGNGGGESSFVVDREYLQHLRSLDPFPRKLHVLFPRKDFYKRRDDHPPLDFVRNGMLRFIDLNPTWNVTVYDDADMDDIIRSAADDGIISMDEMNALVGNETQPSAHRKKFDRISSLFHHDVINYIVLFSNNNEAVERSDLARLLIIWYFGGMYVDVDSLINPRGFDEVFLTTVKMCLPTYFEVNFAQSNVCSSPKNRLYIDIITQMSEHRMKSNGGGGFERRGGWASRSDLFAIGPPMFNRVVFATVFGKRVSGHGTIPGMEDARRALTQQAGDLIATGIWKSQCNSFIAAPFEGCIEWSRKELYDMYNMTRWGVAVNRRWGIDT